MLASSLLGQAYSLMIATISPASAALKHTRSTLHYAGTASSICLAPPKAGNDDLELRNAELEKRNKELLKELEKSGQAYGELDAKMRLLQDSPQDGDGGNGADYDERYEELEAMHNQLTALLQAGDANGGGHGISAAQAAAELAGVPTTSSSSGASLHQQQAALAEARYREHFARAALEGFVRSSLTEEDLPPLPLNSFRSDTSIEENDDDVMSPVGDMGRLAELQARVQMLRNAQRSHKDAWEALVKATSDRVDALRTLKAQLPAAEEDAAAWAKENVTKIVLLKNVKRHVDCVVSIF